MYYFLLLVGLLQLNSAFGALPQNYLTQTEERSWTPQLNHLHPCGGNFCLCDESFAVCVGHQQNLTYIPKLGANIVKINFTLNYLVNVTKVTFENISTDNVWYLYLEQNYISHIAHDAFINFKVLSHLDLNRNPLTMKDIKHSLPSLRNSKLEYLAIGPVDVTDFNEDITEGVSSVRFLYITNKKMTNVNFTVLLGFRHLEHLNLQHNKIYHIAHPILPTLTELSLHSNRLDNMPGFCKEANTSSIRILTLTNNMLSSLGRTDLNCFKELRYLFLTGNAFNVIEVNTFSGLPSLKILNIDKAFGRSRKEVRLKGYAFNNSGLSEIYAKTLTVQFPHDVSRNAFKGCSNLNLLSIPFNSMFSVDNAYLIDLLGDLISLEFLYLQHCQLSFFPRVVAERLLNIKEINLYGNSITTIEEGTFNRLRNLTYLSLGCNGITQLKSGIFPPTFQREIKQINLGDNSFSCTCINLWLFEWIKRDPFKFKEYPDAYMCKSPPQLVNTLVTDAPLSEISCSISRSFPVILGFIGSTVSILILVSVIYRWRWHIRYYIYMMIYKRRKKPGNEENDFSTYDAFVLFCDDDFGWVRRELMPKIEDDAGMRLCVHQRDFTPGEYIVDNIIDSINNSRRVVVVLSNTFSKSHWCQFELAVVQKRALERAEGYLVLIRLEDIEAANMTSSLYALLQTTTYINWPPDNEDKEMFWERLKASVRR